MISIKHIKCCKYKITIKGLCVTRMVPFSVLISIYVNDQACCGSLSIVLAQAD